MKARAWIWVDPWRFIPHSFCSAFCAIKYGVSWSKWAERGTGGRCPLCGGW